MLDAISQSYTAGQSAAAPKPKAAHGFLTALSAQEIVEDSPRAEEARAAEPKWPAGFPAGLMDPEASAARDASMAEARARSERCSWDFAESMRAAFNLVGDTLGFPISESVGYRRSGDHFEFYSLRQRNAGPDDSPNSPHPQGDVLEAIFNGTDPAHADLTKKVKEMLKKADKSWQSAQDAEREFAKMLGTDFTERGTDGDFGFAMPTRFVEAGRALADKDPGAFAAFRGTLSADDLARLSDEQVYSRFFLSHASKEEMQAALDAERKEEAT
ncbi:MAG: hypothetical protein NVV74_04370 [Magnetospirillum sp.]|nr:hypothetical protein [Magnetospirillum sp.]